MTNRGCGASTAQRDRVYHLWDTYTGVADERWGKRRKWVYKAEKRRIAGVQEEVKSRLQSVH